MSASGISQENGFYVTGGTMRRDAPSYVERQADRVLHESLLQGKFCYALTSRQMGKSSLMVRTVARLRESGVGVAVLDLTGIGQSLTVEQWYDGLLGRIGRQLQIEDEIEQFWLNHLRLSPLQRWMSAITDVILPHYPNRLVIFVDEIDAVRSLPFSSDEFFAGIRELYNRRAQEPELEVLTFCLLGVATPTDLIRDTRTTPFNIGQRIELDDFTETEAALLAQGLQKTPEVGARLLARVFYWTGGHPYLTQRLCQVIVEEAREDTIAEVDRLCEELFLSHQAQGRDDNLLFVRERMLRSEVDLAGLLSLYAQVRRGKLRRDDLNDPLIVILRLSGIARAEDGYLAVRNRIYERVFDREWVKTNMPDAEVRRQRSAYRSGLIRATAIAALILMLLAGLSIYAFRQRDHAVLQEQANHRLLYAADMKLAQQAWEDANIGRLQELLESHRPRSGDEDLRGFEWYYLWHLSHGYSSTLQHDYSIFAVAFSPDGKRLATVSVDHAVKLWDVATRLEMLTINRDLPDGNQHVTGDPGNKLWEATTAKEKTNLNGYVVHPSVAFSPDGKKLLTGGSDCNARVWDAVTGQVLLTLGGHSKAVYSVAFSPDGRRLATASIDHTVKLWDAANGDELFTLNGDSIVTSVSFSPDGKRLATGSGDSAIRLWDVDTGKILLTLKGHSDVVGSMAFSPDGKQLASGSYDNTVKLWDAATGKKLLTINGHSDIVYSVAFSPDGKRLATASQDRTVKLWDTSIGQELLTLKGHSTVFSVAFSPDGKQLASGSDDHTAKLWDVAAGNESLVLRGHSHGVFTVAFSPDGKRLATGSDDRKVKLWDLAAGQELLVLRGHLLGVYSVAFSPDGKRLATGSDDRTVKLWDAVTGQELLALKGHSESVHSVAFSLDGRRLATASMDHTVRLWDAATGEELLILRGHSAGVFAVSFSPDGKRLATGCGDGIARLWDTETGRELLTLRGHLRFVTSVAFSPDGKRLATGSGDHTVKLWDTATGQELLTLRGHSQFVFSLAFSPDGKRLATGSTDRTVQLWDAATGQELLTLKGHSDTVFSVAFSPDGKQLATGSYDRTVRLWKAATEQEVLSLSK
ncbi:MAG: PD40 domain-containing protein [Blastocatellia bacterium]|nr:PD40 domain-containing protein [Blastocatellia bacterium]